MVTGRAQTLLFPDRSDFRFLCLCRCEVGEIGRLRTSLSRVSDPRCPGGGAAPALPRGLNKLSPITQQDRRDHTRGVDCLVEWLLRCSQPRLQAPALSKLDVEVPTSSQPQQEIKAEVHRPRSKLEVNLCSSSKKRSPWAWDRETATGLPGITDLSPSLLVGLESLKTL